MRWDMNVLMARSYVLQLADNVKRSLDEARKNGLYPHRHEPLISIELFEKVQKVKSCLERYVSHLK